MRRIGVAERRARLSVMLADKSARES